jgi:hypothetical protein
VEEFLHKMIEPHADDAPALLSSSGIEDCVPGELGTQLGGAS